MTWYSSPNKHNQKSYAGSSIRTIRCRKTYGRNASILKTGFEEAKITATELPESIDAEAVFPAAVQIRVRHNKRLFDYESRDDPIQDPETCYRIENFNVIVDTAINSLAERFSQMQEHIGNFSFLYDIKGLQKLSFEELLKNCQNLHILITWIDMNSATN